MLYLLFTRLWTRVVSVCARLHTRICGPVRPPVVFVIERREWSGEGMVWIIDTTVMHVASTLGHAERWLRDNADTDDGIWWWTVSRDTVDGPLIEHHDLRHYDRDGAPLQRIPSPPYGVNHRAAGDTLLVACLEALHAKVSWGTCSDWHEAQSVWRDTSERMAGTIAAYVFTSHTSLYAAVCGLVDRIRDIEVESGHPSTEFTGVDGGTPITRRRLLHQVQRWLADPSLTGWNSVPADAGCESLLMAYAGLRWYAREQPSVVLATLARAAAEHGIMPLLRDRNVHFADIALHAIGGWDAGTATLPVSLVAALTIPAVPDHAGKEYAS